MPVTYIPGVPAGWINILFHWWRYSDTWKSLVLAWNIIFMRIQSITAKRILLPHFLWALVLMHLPLSARRLLWFIPNPSKPRQGNLEGHITTALISQGTQKLSRNPAPGPTLQVSVLCKEVLICRVSSSFCEPLKWLLFQMFLSSWVPPFLFNEIWLFCFYLTLPTTTFISNTQWVGYKSRCEENQRGRSRA